MVILSNLPPPTEGIRFQQPQTSAVIENQQLGSGTLYITESCLSWVGSEGNGFSLQYPAISLHAVSRDRNSYPEECIFVMVEAPAREMVGSTGTGANLVLTNGADGEDVGDGDADDEEESPITQIRFIPQDKSVLDDVFKAMADCQTLHPDENESFSDDEEDGEEEEVVDDGGGDAFYTSREDVEHLTAEGQAVLQRLNQAAGDGGEPMEEGESENMEAGHANAPDGQ